MKIPYIECILDWILRISGLLALLRGILGVFLKPTGYYDKVEFKVIKNVDEHDQIEEKCIDNFCISNDASTRLIIIVNGADVYNLRIEQIQYLNKNRFKVVKVLKYYKDLHSKDYIMVKGNLSCGCPSYRVSWYLPNGLKAYYYLIENSFNGENDLKYIKYEKTFKYFIPKFIGCN